MSQMLFLAKFPRLPSNWWQLFFRSKKTLVVNHLLLGDKNWSDYSFSLFEDLERWWLYRLYNWNIPYHFSCRKVMQYAWWCIDKFQSSSWLFTYRREEQNRSSLSTICTPIMRVRSTFPTGHISLLDFSLTCPGRTVTLNSWSRLLSLDNHFFSMPKWILMRWLSFALILISPSSIITALPSKARAKVKMKIAGWLILPMLTILVARPVTTTTGAPAGTTAAPAGTTAAPAGTTAALAV